MVLSFESTIDRISLGRSIPARLVLRAPPLVGILMLGRAASSHEADPNYLEQEALGGHLTL